MIAIRSALVCMAAFVLIAAPLAAQTPLTGTWTIEPSGAVHSGMVHLRLRLSRNDSDGNDLALASLGLQQRDFDAAPHPASFALTRDAGRIDFSGTLGDGTGSGRFTFSPNPAYAAVMEQHGWSIKGGDYALAAVLLDISRAYADGLLAQGARISSFEHLIALRALGVTSQYAGELAGVGYRSLTDTNLIQLKALGVDAAYVRYLAAHGYRNLSVSQLVRLKALKV